MRGIQALTSSLSTVELICIASAVPENMLAQTSHKELEEKSKPESTAVAIFQART